MKSQIFMYFHEKAGECKNIVIIDEKQVFHDTYVEKSNSVLDHIQTLGYYVPPWAAAKDLWADAS